MASATPVRITHRPDGLFEIQWADGFTWGPTSLENLKEQLANNAPDDAEHTKWAMLAYALRRSADLTNVTSILNKTLTFDLTTANVWRIQ